MMSVNSDTKVQKVIIIIIGRLTVMADSVFGFI